MQIVFVYCDQMNVDDGPKAELQQIFFFFWSISAFVYFLLANMSLNTTHKSAQSQVISNCPFNMKKIGFKLYITEMQFCVFFGLQGVIMAEKSGNNSKN